jgi:hypothetical protein
MPVEQRGVNSSAWRSSRGPADSYNAATPLERSSRLSRRRGPEIRAYWAGIAVAIRDAEGGDMTRATTALAAALGAGLMYYLDPDRGSRRRTHARNQIRQASNRLRTAPGMAERLRDLGGVRTRRMATALAGVAGLGLTARAAMQARHREFELRS